MRGALVRGVVWEARPGKGGFKKGERGETSEGCELIEMRGL